MAVSVNGRTAHALWKINGDVLRNRFAVLPYRNEPDGCNLDGICINRCDLNTN